MDIQQAMALLQGAMDQGQMGGGMGGVMAPNPMGALQPAGAPPMPAPVQPDYNAILQQQMLRQQLDQAMAGSLGGGAGPAVNPAVHQLMAQHAGRLAGRGMGGGEPRPMGFGGMGPMQPSGPPIGRPTQPAGIATLPGGGMNGALNMRPMPGNAGPAY